MSAAPEPTPEADRSASTPAGVEPVEHRPWVTNLVLLALVGALAVWVWQGEGQTKPTALLEREKRKVFPFFASGDVTRLTVAVGGDVATPVVLVPSGEADAGGRTWRLLEPVADAADDAVVRELLSGMEWLEHQALIEGEALAEYPFGEVAARVAVDRAGRAAPLAFELGAARGGVVPLRRIGEGAPEGVYHVPEAFARRVLREPAAFRSKRLFTRAVRQATALRVVSTPRAAGPGQRREVALSLSEQLWRAGPTGDFADRAKIEALLGLFEDLRAGAIVADADPGDPAALAAFGLAAAPDGFAVTVGEATETLWLGDPIPDRPGARYARVEGRRPIYAVTPDLLEEALARAPAEWLAPELFPLQGGVEAMSGYGAELADGTRFLVERTQDGEWLLVGEGEARIPTDAQAAQALAERLLALRIGERLGGEVDAAALGLDAPAIQLQVLGKTLKQVVRVGEPVAGAPGVHHAQRLLPPPSPPGSAATYTAEIAELSATLAEAPLELLDRRIFRASAYDVRELTLVEPDGTTRARLAKVRPDPKDPAALAVWKSDDTPEPLADEAVFPLFESLEEVYVERYVARTDAPDGEAVLARYGLDAPRVLTLGLERPAPDGTLQIVPHVLRLGRREGQRIYAHSDAIPAVGVIDAGFLDRLERGFAPGLVLWQIDMWKARGLRIEREGRVVLDARKPDVNWKRGTRIVERPGELEDVIELLERVEVTQPEPATPELLRERGLDPPRMKVVITTGLQKGDRVEETEHVLLIGEAAGPRERWAMTPGGQVGRLFDAPLTGPRGVEEYLRKHPDPDAPFPPTPGK